MMVRKIIEKKNCYKFCHTADWHLDYFQYQKKERWQDFINAANDCSELMIKEKPDFILHCGDLFHNFRPTPGAIRFAIKILKKFRKANIPFYVIRGNHDASKAQAQRFGGTILKFLEELGYVIYIQDEIINVNDDIAITGIGEYGKATAQVIEEVIRNNPLDKNKFNILLIHGYLQGQVSDSIFDLSGYQLASIGFDYIAVGHYHKRWEEPENNIYCPGSTEQTSINDWGNPDKDGFIRKASFYLVTVKKEAAQQPTAWTKKVSTKEFPIRPKGRFIFTFSSNEPMDYILQKADAFVKQHDLQDAIIRFDFNGEMPIGKRSILNFSKLPSIQNSKALYVIVNAQISSQTLGQAQTGLKMEEALIELLNSYGYKKPSIVDAWVDLTNETIKVLGQKNFPSEEYEEVKVLYHYLSQVAKKYPKTKLAPKKEKAVRQKKIVRKKSQKSKSQQPRPNTQEAAKNSSGTQVDLSSFIKDEENL